VTLPTGSKSTKESAIRQQDFKDKNKLFAGKEDYFQLSDFLSRFICQSKTFIWNFADPRMSINVNNLLSGVWLTTFHIFEIESSL
jgi:hypothetical protein